MKQADTSVTPPAESRKPEGENAQANEETTAALRRVLGRQDVLALAFGAMVGWGWVVLAGTMISRAGTVGSIVAIGIGAVMVLLVGLTYAELTSAVLRAGGELGFTYLGLGPNASFVCGWTLALAYLSICAFEAVALPTVVDYLIPGFEQGFMYSVAGWDVHVSWVAVGSAGALVIGAVNYIGLRPAAVLQAAGVAFLFLVGLAFFIPGTVQGTTANLEPLFTSWGGLFQVVIMTPFIFLGFDVIPQTAEEIDVPHRTIGTLMVVSIGVALVWYVLVQWTVGMNLGVAALADTELATADAMAAVYDSAWAGKVLVIGGLLGIITSWNAFFVGASRLFFAMARGGMLPKVFTRLHPRHESPVAVVAVITAISALAPLLGRRALVWFVDAGGLAAVIGYFLVTISFLRLRSRHPELPRPYTVPMPRLVGTLALVTTLFFILLYMPGSPSALVWPYEWAIVGVWVALGAVFAAIARRRIAKMGRAHQAELILGEYVRYAPASSPSADASDEN